MNWLKIIITGIAVGLLIFFFVIILVDGGKKISNPEKFIYNKHDYLFFKNKGLVHDPDCHYCLTVFD